MATNTYEVGLKSGPVRLEAEGFRVKDDGWVHFYVAGPTPESPKETVLSLSPGAGVLVIQKMDHPLYDLSDVGDRIIESLDGQTFYDDSSDSQRTCVYMTDVIRVVREECGMPE